MAMYHWNAQMIKRSAGRSALEAVAYRKRTTLTDPRTGMTYNHSRTTGLLHSEVLAPPGRPDWTLDSVALWTAVEQREPRKNSQLAREIHVTLISELTFDQNRMLLNKYVMREFVAEGMIADISIHAPREGGDPRNLHAHIMLTTRRVAADGFGPKERAWNERDLATKWRKAWADLANEELERLGFPDRIDHRSFAERGIDREPLNRLDRTTLRKERAGERTPGGNERRAIIARNREREENERRLHDLRAELDSLTRLASQKEAGPSISAAVARNDATRGIASDMSKYARDVRGGDEIWFDPEGGDDEEH